MFVQSDSGRWILFNSVTSQQQPNNPEIENIYYTPNNSGLYSKYRIVFEKTWGGDCINMAQFNLYYNSNVAIYDNVIFTSQGDITLAKGRVTGNVTGDLTGNVTGATGTFSNLLSANGGLTSTTGTFNGLLTANGGITGNLTGNADTSDRLKLQDTRDTTSLPNYYASKTGLTYEFKRSSAVGLSGLAGVGNFVLLQTITPWANNTGDMPIQQIATTGKEKYTRYAMPQDANWGEWENQYYNSFTTVSSPNTTFTTATAWTVVNDSKYDPAIRSPYLGRAYNNKVHDQSAVGNNIDIVVPAGMRTGYVHYLPWSNCRYFDIVGVSSDNKEVFIKRINSYFTFPDMGQKNLEYYDGMAISAVPRADRFSKIRIKGVKGSIMYMGMAWNNDVVSSDNTGFLNADNVFGNFQILDTGDDVSRFGRINIWGGDKTINSNSHFNYNGTNENWISGKTNFRGNSGAPICIGDTCITEDDLKKIKNNNFPSLSVNGTNLSTTYLTKSDAGTTYLTKSDAGTTYLKKSDADTTYLTKDDAIITYLPKSSVQILSGNVQYNGTIVKIPKTNGSWSTYNSIPF